jgi:Ca2+-binding EF-hand superfamily protein
VKRFIPYLATAFVLSTATLPAAAQKVPSPADQAKATEAAMQQMLRQFDRDGDGKLNPQEQAAADQTMMQGAVGGMPVGNNPFLKQFDRDGDGKLNPAEMRQAREYWDRMRRKGGGPQRGFDPRGGGNAPQPAAPAAEAKREKEKVSPLVKRFDKDGDGKLNETEKAAAQAELKKDKKKDKGEKEKGKGEDKAGN